MTLPLESARLEALVDTKIVDLARSRRTDRILGWIAVVVVQGFLAIGLSEMFQGRATYLEEKAWAEAQIRAGRRVAILFYPAGEPPILRTVLQLWAMMELGVIAAVFVLLKKGRQRLILTPQEIVVDQRFGGVRTTYAAVDRLAFFQRPGSSGYAGYYSIETRDGRITRFKIDAPDAGNPEVGQALSLIAARTGRYWSGAGEKQPRSFRTFLRELRTGAGVRSNWGLSWWALKHAVMVNPAGAGGVEFALLRWTVPLFVFPFLAFIVLIEFWWLLSPLLIIGSDMVGSGPDQMEEQYDFVRQYVVLPRGVVGFLLLSWVSTFLGINIVLTLLRLQERKREAVEADLRAARELQSRLLPAGPPVFEGYDVAGVYVPAREVAGDYYDFIVVPGKSLTIPVADVSGKGLPAGLLMTMIKGALVTRLQTSDDLAHVLSSLNRTIRQTAQNNIFISMVLARVGGGSRVLSVARAGHSPPLLIRASGTMERLQPPGIALGLDAGSVFDRVCIAEDVTLGSGDVLILYTDGVTEAMNTDGEEFGEERLAASATAVRDQRAEAVCNRIIEDVSRFRGAAEINDDLTLVIVRAH